MSTTPIPIRFELLDGSVTKKGTITHTPFTFGRLPECDVVLVHPFVSRKHAEVQLGEDGYYLSDLGSRHGTFVNGALLPERHLLQDGDSIHFGALDGPSLWIDSSDTKSSTSLRVLIEQMPSGASASTGLEKLRWFFESARKLGSVGAVDQILAALLEITLELTQVERGYVYLFRDSGALELALGRDQHGATMDDSTLSRGAIDQAISTSSDYIITDTLSAENRTDSIVAHSIRSVICIPLRKRRASSETGHEDLLGLLYLDSRIRAGSLTKIDSDLLKTIATNAAALIDNAQLALAEESERRYREELSIAADIQKNLMVRKLPLIPYASLAARSIPCLQVGGDFFDIINSEDSLSVVVADVSGKGISAAILACTLQGMIYSQLIANQPLSSIAAVVNRYICSKKIGKYATMTILRMGADGSVDYINCGHVPPFLHSASGCSRLAESNLPVGLIAEASFESAAIRVAPGSRILIVTDGVTEAEDGAGEFFGEERVAGSIAERISFDGIYDSIGVFCGPVPLNDDCTMLEIAYTG